MPRINGPDLKAVLDAARREGPSPYLKGIVKSLEDVDYALLKHYEYVRLQKTQSEKRRNK